MPDSFFFLSFPTMLELLRATYLPADQCLHKSATSQDGTQGKAFQQQIVAYSSSLI